MDLSLSLTVLGTVLTASSLLVAALQTVRLRTLRRRTSADLWFSISIARSMLEKLEGGEIMRTDAAVASVYGKLGELFRHLLKQAVLDEPTFTEDTIHLWRRAGKLEGPWQEAQARLFISTSDIEPTNTVTIRRP